MRRSTSKRKQFKRLIPLVLLTVALGACGAKNGSSTSTNSSSTSKVTTVKLSNYFTKRDQDASYDESKATKISLSGSSAKASGSGAEVSGSTVTITKAGTYILSGSSENVQIIVKAKKKDKVQLVLNGVRMTGTDAAIVVENADKTFITLAKGSKNTISDSAHHKNTKYDAAITVKMISLSMVLAV